MIEILHFDKDKAVCIKPVGVSSENEGMPELVRTALEEKGVQTQVYPIHRLDTAVGGLMIFALNKKYAAFMSEKIARGEGIKKEYLAVVHGKPAEEKGVYADLLFKDSRQGKSFIVKRERKGVKKASLEYEVLGSGHGFSLVRILLHTGRTHQIRVQFSGRKMPLAGDGKYGGKDNFNIALLSFRLTLDTGESWSIEPENKFPWNIFKETHLY